MNFTYNGWIGSSQIRDSVFTLFVGKNPIAVNANNGGDFVAGKNYSLKFESGFANLYEEGILKKSIQVSDDNQLIFSVYCAAF